MQVMGMDDRAPSGYQRRAMQEIVHQAMVDGAVGLSAGLTYAPAVYSNDDELVDLCRPLVAWGGHYQPHHRNYGQGALDAYAASIDIGRRASVAVHLTHAHMSTPANRGRAPELLKLVTDSRVDGVDVTLDSYPYLAGKHLLARESAELGAPGWQFGHPAALAGSYRATTHQSGDGRRRLELDIPIQRFAARRPSVVGLNVADAARAAGKPSAFDFYCDLLVDDDLGVGAIILGIKRTSARFCSTQRIRPEATVS